MTRNPFDSLYVTETIDPERFVDIFSPLLVHDTLALFQPGNVVLMGSQGSGKSMLLALLKPEVKLAFDSTKTEFPLERKAPPFVSGGINLIRSGIIEFGQRPIPRAEADEQPVLQVLFADFLNYWIVRDLLRSLHVLRSHEVDDEGRESQIDTRTEYLDAFAKGVSNDDRWAGGLAGVKDYATLKLTVNARIRAYRDFLNYNIDGLPIEMTRSKTSAGEPISSTVTHLRNSRVISEATQCYVRIDQYEELLRLNDWQLGSGSGDEVSRYSGFASVIHKMLGLRDPHVSYRVGTRRHAWPQQPQMQGTSAAIEELRNYKIIDLDGLLRRKEHSAGPFPKFAEDVFRRRVQAAGYDCARAPRCVREVFGSSPEPDLLAEIYARNASEVVSIDPSWPEHIARTLEELARINPLSAKLGEAWLRQKWPREEPSQDSDGRYPWESATYWRKERVALALLQIAARQRQRMVWAGEQNILDLSGQNILTFVSLCQSIWNAWLRSPDSQEDTLPRLPRIRNLYTQDEGIQEASTYWYEKIPADPDGHSRQRFVAKVGALFREWLRSDVRMSYPGHNGFSLDDKDLGAPTNRDVESFLEKAAGFGILIDKRHTTRNKNGGIRRKWYLNPAYCPYFQIPVAHVKEPRYVRAAEVRNWMQEVEVIRSRMRSPAPSDQLDLFGDPVE